MAEADRGGGGVSMRAVGADEAGLRVDRWFRRHFPHLPHGRLEKLLRGGQVRLDGHRVKAGDRLQPGQLIRVPPLSEPPATPDRRSAPPATDDAASRAALEEIVLYRDETLIVLNKPAGLAVQGGTGTKRHLDAMLSAFTSARVGGGERPRLVHRLDKDTSGVIVVARTAAAAAALTRAFRDRAARKLYWAIVVGVPKPERGRIDLALAKEPGRHGERVQATDDGDPAITEFAVVERAGRRAAWLELSPLTGRTHQLRAHCAAIGTPILGDGKYGGQEAFLDGTAPARILNLHARALAIPHPAGGILEVEAPLPEHMRATWRFFGFGEVPARPPRHDRRAQAPVVSTSVKSARRAPQNRH